MRSRAVSTAWRVAGDTPGLPLSTRLTVASLTPACAAMSARRVVMGLKLAVLLDVPPQCGVRGQLDVVAARADRPAREQGRARRADPRGAAAHVDGAREPPALTARGLPDEHQCAGWAGQPAQFAVAEGRVLAPQAQRLPVEGQHGTGVLVLRGDREVAPLGGDREPGVRARAEAERGLFALPGQRDAAAVAAGALAAQPLRVLLELLGKVEHLGQAELLALVDVGRAGQRERQQRRRAGAPQAPLAVAVPGDVP